MASAPGEVFRRIREAAATLGWREAARGILDCYREHHLTVQASAIANRLLLALVPCLLFLLGLLGFLGLDEIWRQDLAPDVRKNVSSASFQVINDAVTHVLTEQRGFWLTGGALLAIWQLSGVVRASGHVLNRLYGVEPEEERSKPRAIAASLVTAAGVGALLLAALAVLRLGPIAIDQLLPSSAFFQALAFLVRWIVGAALLLLAIGLVVRAGPEVDRPAAWVSFGALLVVIGWAVFSALFGLYLVHIASYSTIFGNLATVFVLLEYLFFSANVFLGGLVLDRLIQERARA